MKTRSCHISAADELSALENILERILKKGHKHGNYLEVLGLLVSIQYSPDTWAAFCDFQSRFLEIGAEVAKLGWRRATRVYTDTLDRPTKPSYLGRLISYSDKPRRCKEPQNLDQLDKISDQLASKPGFSNLSFVILRPADLHDQFRPGYVPCAIAGDFKFRGGFLDLNVMFRTSDAVTVGYADIYYLRHIQLSVLASAQAKTKNKKLIDGNPGLLNLFFARSYIERKRKIKTKDGTPEKMICVEDLGKLLAREIALFRQERQEV